VVKGPDLRRGVSDLDGTGEVVSGIVVMRQGQNALDVIERVKEKIKDLLAPDAIKPLTRLILTNAIYFKSAWAQEFSKDATKDEPFQLGGGQTKNVPLMNQQKRFRYFESEQLQALELPYQQGALGMIVILPRKVDGLSELEKALTQQNVNKWIDGMNSRLVRVFLPRFKIEAQFGLADTLKSMGMTDAFSDTKADFSGIATMEKLFIFDVVHKAFVDVNEEGTEAAAATAVIMGVRSAVVRPEEPVVFRADHPFIFAIRHRDSGAILFLGRLAKP
jgi:serpin B